MKELIIVAVCVLVTVGVVYACNENVRQKGLKHYIDIVWLGEHTPVKAKTK